uniref:Uncharacterized protein n=1 Tax=Anguilla anguilla TaxID=7936 RepID=A0A0E9SPL9_ANGAN
MFAYIFMNEVREYLLGGGERFNGKCNLDGCGTSDYGWCSHNGV